MVMQWARAHFGAGAANVVLGFQAPTGVAGARVTPARVQAEAPKLGWLDRLDRWFWSQEQAQREAYLAKASDVFDLERRMRTLERAGRHGLY
jgi:hypothetical protein